MRSIAISSWPDGRSQPTKGGANDCLVSSPDAGTQVDAPMGSADGGTSVPSVVVNEVESTSGVPGDWAELFNAGTFPVDVSGWVFKDNDNTHAFVIPGGTTIPTGGDLVLEEAGFGFGLGAGDSARLFAADGTTLVDSYTWVSAAVTTYGRCPNGTGAFTTTGAPTKGGPRGPATTTL